MCVGSVSRSSRSSSIAVNGSIEPRRSATRILRRDGSRAPAPRRRARGGGRGGACRASRRGRRIQAGRADRLGGRLDLDRLAHMRLERRSKPGAPTTSTRSPAARSAKRRMLSAVSGWSCTASGKLERLLSRRRSCPRRAPPRSAQYRADPRARGQPELVAADERLGRLVRRGRAGPRRRARRRRGSERLERPGLGGAAEAVDRARRAVRRAARPRARAREARGARWRSGGADALAERATRRSFGSCRRGRGALDGRRAARAGRARRAGGSRRPRAARARRGSARRRARSRATRARRTSRSVSGSRRKPSSSSRRTARSRRSGSSSKIVVRDGAEHLASRSRLPPKGSTRSPPATGSRDRVDGEVARGEVVLDRAAKRREVHRAAAVERDAPGAVTLGERERRAARPPREGPRGRLGSRQATSRSTSGRPSSSSRIPPPTTQASSPRRPPATQLTHRRPLRSARPATRRCRTRARS